MRDHATDDAPEHARRSAKVKGAASGVHNASLSQVIVILELVAEMAATQAQSLASDNNNFLSIQQMLGNNTGKSTNQVILSINNDNLNERMNENGNGNEGLNENGNGNEGMNVNETRLELE